MTRVKKIGQSANLCAKKLARSARLLHQSRSRQLDTKTTLWSQNKKATTMKSSCPMDTYLHTSCVDVWHSLELDRS